MKDDYYSKKIYTKINRFRREALLDLIGESSGLVLDIGCGDGSLGETLKNKVHGIDVSVSAVEIAKTKLDQAFVFDVGGEAGWPETVQKHKYDIIIISEVLEHLFYPEKVLEKIKLISHSDTKIIITVPNLLFWKNRFKIFFGSFDYADSGLMDRGHIHFFSWESLEKMIKENGFEILEIKHHFPTRGTKILGNFFPGFFAYQFIFKIKMI